MFVHSDGQLSAAHLILNYDPIYKSFQAPKCVIKYKDPRLQRISVATLGFLASVPIPYGIHLTTPILEGIPKVGASSSRPVVKEEKEEKEAEETEEGEVVELFDSEDDFTVFNQPLSPKNTLSDLDHSFPVQSSQQQGTSSIPDDMGIQRKLRATLEAQLGGNAPGKAPQAKLPTAPPP